MLRDGSTPTSDREIPLSQGRTVLYATRPKTPARLIRATRSFDGARLHTPEGPVFMPTFGAGYSDTEIAGVAKYVTARFGMSASSISPDEVAKRRRRN